MKDGCLSEADFVSVKKEIKQLWRKMGMLHLRMTNDLDIKNPRPINKEEIKVKLTVAQEQINFLLNTFL